MYHSWGSYDSTDYIYFLQGINVCYLVIHLKYMNKPLKVLLFILHKVEEETAAKCHWWTQPFFGTNILMFQHKELNP